MNRLKSYSHLIHCTFLRARLQYCAHFPGRKAAIQCTHNSMHTFLAVKLQSYAYFSGCKGAILCILSLLQTQCYARFPGIKTAILRILSWLQSYADSILGTLSWNQGCNAMHNQSYACISVQTFDFSGTDPKLPRGQRLPHPLPEAHLCCLQVAQTGSRAEFPQQFFSLFKSRHKGLQLPCLQEPGKVAASHWPEETKRRDFVVNAGCLLDEAG